MDMGPLTRVMRALSSDSLLRICVAGMSRFLSGVTDNMKQHHRERLFAVTHKSLVEAAER